MNAEQLAIYCGLLEQVADPWMLEHAAKGLQDAINPDVQRKKLEDAATKAWRQYTSRFDANLFAEAALYYAEYLSIKAGLSRHNSVYSHTASGDIYLDTNAA